MFIATAPPGPHQLRRSGMFIGTATNNDLRKLRQERHGTIRLLQSDMPLLTELDSRGIASAINMPLLTELSPTGRPRQ